MPSITVGPLTKPCDCHPINCCTSREGSCKIMRRMLQAPNVSRSKFKNLANSYFAIAGRSNYYTRDTGSQLTWKCLLCKTGHLRMKMNRNSSTELPKYQLYGTITAATPCTDTCLSHSFSIAAKTIWLPRSHTVNEMVITLEQIKQKKLQHENWIKEARHIAQELIKENEIRKNAWKLETMTEQEIRNRIEKKNAKIAKQSKKKRKINEDM